MNEQEQQPLTGDDSLENKDTTSEDSASTSTTPQSTPVAEPNAPKPKRNLYRMFQDILSHFNPYMLGFVLLLTLAGIGLYVLNARNTNEQDQTVNQTTQQLTSDALNQLKNSDVKIGDPKQVLGIESNTIFAGKVLIRDSLDIAGSLKLGGSLSLPGLTVAGTSSFDQIQANGITISNDAAIRGQLTVQRSLNVSGGGTFGGPLTAPQITVDTLQLTRDLQLNHHIDPVGGTPGKSDGTALGGGGTSSVSGTDTAGTVAINTGNGPPAGCFMTINFTRRFTGTPHVSLTPANSAAASLNFYVNRSATNMSVCTASAPTGGQNYVFDYIVID